MDILNIGIRMYWVQGLGYTNWKGLGYTNLSEWDKWDMSGKWDRSNPDKRDKTNPDKWDRSSPVYLKSRANHILDGHSPTQIDPKSSKSSRGIEPPG